MKKLFSILLLSIFSIAATYAQGVIGVKGGLSHSGILVENPDGGLIPGFVGGITYDLKLSDKLSLGAEVLYSQQGVYKNSDLGYTLNEGDLGLMPERPGFLPVEGPLNSLFPLTYSAVGESHIRLNYINVPIVLKYGFGENNNFKLFGGGQIGFLVSSKVTFDGDFSLTNGEGVDMLPELAENPNFPIPADNESMGEMLDAGAKFNNIDFAFVVGASYDFNNTPLTLDIRANYGMIDVNGDPEAAEEDWMKNMTLQLTLKYSIFGKN